MVGCDRLMSAFEVGSVKVVDFLIPMTDVSLMLLKPMDNGSRKVLENTIVCIYLFDRQVSAVSLFDQLIFQFQLQLDSHNIPQVSRCYVK